MENITLALSGDRVLPYVYRLTHRETGRFYIGVRCKNVSLGLRPEDDLGKTYKTSSKEVKPKFDEYSYMVVAECFDKAFAYDLERKMINEAMGNPLLINKRIYGFGYNPISPMKGRKQSEEAKRKIGDAHRGMKRRPGTGDRISKALTGRKQPWSDEQKRKHRERVANRPVTDEWRKKLSEGQQRRFQDPAQHESNRRAAKFGLIARMKSGSIQELEVSSNGCRAKVFYASVGVFCKASGFSNGTIYSAIRRYSGQEVPRGVLKGLVFRLLAPTPLPEGVKMFTPPNWWDVVTGKVAYA